MAPGPFGVAVRPPGPAHARAGAHRLAVHHPRPRGRRAAVMRRHPQGSVRGTELSPDEKCQSASSGSSRRHPARRLVVAGPPGTPAHWHISTGRVAVLLAVNGLLPRESLLHPLREVRCCFFQAARPATPGVAQPGAQPPGLSRLAAQLLLTPGRRNDPCGTCPPGSPLLWAGRPLTSQPPTRSSGPFTRDLTHNPQPRAHPSTTPSTQSHPIPPPEHHVPTVREKPLTPHPLPR